MGEMVMKKLFQKDNFYFFSYDKRQKKQAIVVFALLFIFFLAAAFAFVNAFYSFVNSLGSIVCGSIDVAVKDFLRSVPLYLSFFVTFWAFLIVYSYYRNVDEIKRKIKVKKRAIVIIVLGTINILYVLIGLMVGKYLSIVEGSPSPLFPLDSILYTALFIVLAVLVLVYFNKFEKKHPYVVPIKEHLPIKKKSIYYVGLSLWIVVSLYSFSAFWMGIFIIDYIHGYLFFSLSLMLLLLLSWVVFILWGTYFPNLKIEKKKELLLPLGIITFSVSIVVIVLYHIALAMNLDGPTHVGFGVLPATFSASINIETNVITISLLIFSIVTIVKGIKYRKNK